MCEAPTSAPRTSEPHARQTGTQDDDYRARVVEPFDPRPSQVKNPDDVPVVVVADADLARVAAALSTATAAAIDTETVFTDGPIGPDGPGALRVVSVATRGPDAEETAWVIDVNQVDRHAVAVALSGSVADAWNATFDARVIDRDLMEPARRAGHDVVSPVWWDAQLADALLHQGLSGFAYFHGLAWASEWYLGVRATGKGTTQLSYTSAGSLTDEQIRYAAADAVETLWVGDVIRRQIRDAGLETVDRLEQGARPFLDTMERVGLPFDWPGWEAELAAIADRREGVLGLIAEMTGGGQGTLFSEHLEPAWNPGSEAQTKEMLNQFAADEVAAWTAQVFGAPRRLVDTDPLPADVLMGIGGPLCDALLEYRDLSKTLSTYGDSFGEHLHEDGRIHPEYIQVVGTNTGRLASRNPNAQNLTPKMKSHIRPSDDDRVFVYADLSQAELRFVAQVSGDAALRQAFVDGIDVHEATAERMFRVDMTALRSTDRVRYDELRDKSKRINFGIVYGQRGAGLARSLTQSGVETSDVEGRQLLESYLAVYPGVADWVDARDRFVDDLADSRPELRWDLALQLHGWWPGIYQARRSFRDEHRRWPAVEEIFERRTAGDPETLAETAWTMSFAAPVALDADGRPFGFASTTVAGRRQQFTFHMESILGTAAAVVMRSTKSGPGRVRRQVVTSSGAMLASLHGIGEAALTKLLEDRALRRAIVDQVAVTMGEDARNVLLDNALRQRIARMANAYRNAPIQGGVADVMLEAYGMLHQRLRSFPDAAGVQTVHDSVVVECPADRADELAAVVKSTLEDAMALWCPDIPAVADTDIRRSLSDADVVTRLP